MKMKKTFVSEKNTSALSQKKMLWTLFSALTKNSNCTVFLPATNRHLYTVWISIQQTPTVQEPTV